MGKRTAGRCGLGRSAGAVRLCSETSGGSRVWGGLRAWQGLFSMKQRECSEKRVGMRV